MLVKVVAWAADLPLPAPAKAALYSYQEIIAATLRHYDKEITRNITNNNMLLLHLRKNGKLRVVPTNLSPLVGRYTDEA